MCGIALVLAAQGQGHAACSDGSTNHDCLQLLQRRGPDSLGHVEAHASNASLRITASLLQLRGQLGTGRAPLSDKTSGPGDAIGDAGDDSVSILAYNGEVYEGLPGLLPGASDGECLFKALSGPPGCGYGTVAEHIANVMSGLRGPWAILYWHASSRTLWFGRDMLGRRSLLLQFQHSGCGELRMCSVAVSSTAATQAEAGGAARNTHQPQTAAEVAVTGGDPNVGNVTKETDALVTAATWQPWCALAAANPAPPWQEVPPGLYSLTHYPSEGSDVYSSPGPPHATFVIIAGERWLFANHAWTNATTSCLAAYERPVRLTAPDASLLDCQPAAGTVPRSNEPALRNGGNPSCQLMHTPISDCERQSGASLRVVEEAVLSAVRMRCGCIDTPPQQAAGHWDTLLPAPVLVLFSGGVDSTLLAAAVHRYLPQGQPVDLSNVCFDGGRSPDRRAAISALQELREYAPDREWRLIQVDASLADVDAHRQHLLRLLHPAHTVMDLNIGAALWLAVKAEGELYDPLPQQCPGRDGASPRVQYRSRARVVLLGHGADEQCAGYGRHRTRFAEGGWRGLAEELALDVRRLWLRNLGRDDRLVTDWGREARHPFLDEAFMHTLLTEIPLPELADLHAPPGVGDKRLLRALLASWGLPLAAARVKRAIQFGTRIGQLSNQRDYGSGRAANKLSAGGRRVITDAE